MAVKLNNPFVTILIVNYNGKKYLNESLSSLQDLNYDTMKLSIIVIDNGSTDGSVTFIKQKFPQVKIIKNRINNYCKALNRGIRNTKAELIGILNNDTKVEKDWLVRLVGVLIKNKKIGGVTGKTLLFNQELQGTGHTALPDFYWEDRGYLDTYNKYSKTEEVDSISGCASLYRAKCLKQAGLFDEDFEMYLEDVDLSIRAAQKGWKFYYVPEAIVYHRFHGTAQESELRYYLERNRLYLLAKHYPEKLADNLFGKGYFSWHKDSQDKNSLLKVLPDVLTKLEKHHSAEKAMELIPEIFQSLKKILNFNEERLIKHYSNRINKLEEDSISIADFQNEIKPLNIKKIFIIKSHIVSVEEFIDCIEYYKRVYPLAQKYILANLFKEDYNTVLKIKGVDGFYLYSPDKKPLTSFQILKLGFKLKFKKFDILVILTKHLEDPRLHKSKLLASFIPARFKKIRSVIGSEIVLSSAKFSFHVFLYIILIPFKTGILIFLALFFMFFIVGGSRLKRIFKK